MKKALISFRLGPGPQKTAKSQEQELDGEKDKRCTVQGEFEGISIELIFLNHYQCPCGLVVSEKNYQWDQTSGAVSRFSFHRLLFSDFFILSSAIFVEIFSSMCRLQLMVSFGRVLLCQLWVRGHSYHLWQSLVRQRVAPWPDAGGISRDFRPCDPGASRLIAITWDWLTHCEVVNREIWKIRNYWCKEIG